MATVRLRHLLTRQAIQRAAFADLRAFLEVSNSPDVVSWKDDFFGDSLNATYQTTTANSGTAPAMAATEIANGEIELVTGATNDGASGLSLNTGFRGDLNAIIMCRLKISSLSDVKVEMGFTDAHGDAGAVNVLATPNNTADDAVVWILDTDDGGNSTKWQAVGIDTTTVATKIEPALTPVAGTYETLIVELIGGKARFYRMDFDHLLTYTSDIMDAAVTETVVLTPWIFAQTRTTSSKTLTVDYMHVWQRRTAIDETGKSA